MNAFTLAPRPAITGGPGRLDGLTELLGGLGISGTVMVVVDPVLRIAERASALVSAANLDAAVVEVPPGEPKEALVDALAARAQTAAVVCIGGGSVIDAAKLAACLVGQDEPVAGFRLAARPLPVRTIPLIAVPTTSGTGAEATTTAILSDQTGTKYWFWSDGLRPDHILLDPVLTVKLPAAVTAATGLDALVHALEAATNRNTTPAVLPYARAAVEAVTANLVRAVEEPSDLEARAALQMAATFAGLAIDNAGTGIAHAVGHALGSLAGVGHGRAVAIGLCATLVWSIEGQEAAYHPVATAMGLATPSELPERVTELAHRVGLDFRLDGITIDQLASQIAQPENQAMLAVSLRPVTEADIRLFAEATLALAQTSGDPS